jgi:hypothetical protein
VSTFVPADEKSPSRELHSVTGYLESIGRDGLPFDAGQKSSWRKLDGVSPSPWTTERSAEHGEEMNDPPGLYISRLLPRLPTIRSERAGCGRF